VCLVVFSGRDHKIGLVLECEELLVAPAHDGRVVRGPCA
jgi:hypothetical protein